jgi:hypothetical protein
MFPVVTGLWVASSSLKSSFGMSSLIISHTTKLTGVLSVWHLNTCIWHDYTV